MGFKSNTSAYPFDAGADQYAFLAMSLGKL